MHNPFRGNRPNKKRTEPRRVRDRRQLKGAEKTQLRNDAFIRSKGICEMRSDDCEGEIYIGTFHLAHKRHGARKSDALDSVLAACPTCHRNSHNAGGKPVPRRPGRVMSKSEARKYLRGKLCVCGAAKKQDAAFCESCNAGISAQSRMNLEELHNEHWLRAFSDAEKELLTREQEA